jgi:hypothetical protein
LILQVRKLEVLLLFPSTGQTSDRNRPP